MQEEGNLTIPTLKRISSDLRAVGSRALKSSGENAKSNLLRLLHLIRSTPILRQEVDSAPEPTYDVMNDLQQACETSSRLDPPIDEEEELGYLHSLLEQVTASEEEEFWRITYRYAGKRGAKDCLEAFLYDSVQPYVSILARRLAGRIMATERSSGHSVEVNISGGQPMVNVAQSGSRIVAKQEVREEISDILDAMEELDTAIARCDEEAGASEDLMALAEVNQGVREELTRDEPRKQFLQMFHDRMIMLQGSLTAAETVFEKVKVVASLLQNLFA